jgi:hypothetical protein
VKTPVLRPLSAAEQLKLPLWAGRMLPLLLRRGVAPREGWALAYNCALVWRAIDKKQRPYCAAGLLRRFTLAQLAELARQYWEHSSWEEGAVNEGEGADGV